MFLGDIPELVAHRSASTVAVRAGDRSLTFAQLRDQCWQLSNALLDVAQPGERVAILAENCLEYVLCYYAVPGAGMGLTFLNYRLAAPELAYIIGDAEPSVLIVEEKYIGAVARIRDRISSVRHFIVIGDGGSAADWRTLDEFCRNAPVRRPAVRIGETDLAWLLYTSGTTGLPKGAALTHRNVTAGVTNALVSWEAVRAVEGDPAFLLTFPMFHIAAFALVYQHMRGVPVIIMGAFEPECWFSLIETFRVTETSAAPTMITMLLDHPAREKYDLSSLLCIGYGASAMPAAVLRRANACWPNVRFFTGFGMTELSGNVMLLTSQEHIDAAARDLPTLNSVGRDMLLSRVQLIDPTGRVVGPGEEGEIVVKGDQVLSGYWRNPDATERSFTDGWFHTGDVGRRDENGYLYIVDRMKDMIITGGENVYPREVEEVLYRHDGILEAAVIGIPHEKWGEEVVAVVTLRSDSAVSGGDVIAFCRDRIAGYKKPRAVAFVVELPKNASGKILKRQLRDDVVAGILQFDRS